MLDSAPMERLRTFGALFALVLFGIVVVSLLHGFQTAIGQPLALLLGIALGAAMILVLLRVALVPERRYTGWVRGLTGRNGRVLFFILIVAWTIGMAGLASMNLGPNEAGAPALVGLFAGFFLFMGFIWSVIGE